jgi:uncharacterized protein YxeA
MMKKALLSIVAVCLLIAFSSSFLEKEHVDIKTKAIIIM